MMPRLQAEETLDQSVAGALGSGTLERSLARRLTRDLQRQAQPPGSRAPAATADPATLALMGIKVERV